MILKNNIQKKSNSNPFKSLFEVEQFLRRISNIKNIFSVAKGCGKMRTNLHQ